MATFTLLLLAQNQKNEFWIHFIHTIFPKVLLHLHHLTMKFQQICYCDALPTSFPYICVDVESPRKSETLEKWKFPVRSNNKWVSASRCLGYYSFPSIEIQWECDTFNSSLKKSKMHFSRGWRFVYE